MTDGGPYIVSGNVPIYEKKIVRRDGIYVWEDGRELPQSERYALCRCGKSNNPPFCDASHGKRFSGKEKADMDDFEVRAKRTEGSQFDLLDDVRCGKARFCHRHGTTTWNMMDKQDDPEVRNELIRAACECPAGRTVLVDKDGNIVEDKLEPAIYIVQDPENNVSGGIYVMGGIPIIAADGTPYQVRNRVLLCRCGSSSNTPFCDASHISRNYKDSRGSFSLFKK